MSWLRPEGIQPSDYDPEARVRGFYEEHPELGKFVLDAFTQSDPLHVFMGDNTDEYLGYAKRFIAALGEKDLNALSKEEAMALVRSSFHASQIEQGFVEDADIERVAERMARQE